MFSLLVTGPVGNVDVGVFSIISYPTQCSIGEWGARAEKVSRHHWKLSGQVTHPSNHKIKTTILIEPQACNIAQGEMVH